MLRRPSPSSGPDPGLPRPSWKSDSATSTGGPPTFGSSRPETARILSRTDSPSSRRSGKWWRRRFLGSSSTARGSATDCIRQVLLVTISRTSRFMLHPSSRKRTASVSRRAPAPASANGSPSLPKLSGVGMRPRPKRWCQNRFTATRAVRGFEGSRTRSASSRRPEDAAGQTGWPPPSTASRNRRGTIDAGRAAEPLTSTG